MRVRPVGCCLLCGRPGRRLYADLTDRSFEATGCWGFAQCEGLDCGLVWLDPQPLLEDLALAYRGYYTHAQPVPGSGALRVWLGLLQSAFLARRLGYPPGSAGRWGPVGLWVLSSLARLHPGGEDELCGGAMYLPAPRRQARLLDVGCGSGVHLVRMQDLGWEVEGVEVDLEAVKAARARGISVRAGTLQDQQYPAGSFDAVTCVHVLEHVHDPVGLLREIARVLRMEGRLVVVTPNIESLGHRRYGAAWLNLDPPRHLYLFSARTLRRVAEMVGLKVLELRSTARSAWVYGALSRAIARTGRGRVTELNRLANLVWGGLYQLRMRWWLRRDPWAGDELLLIARPNRG